MANAPYGYKKITVDRRPTLEPYEAEARFVRLMFDMYIHGYGCTVIAGQVKKDAACSRHSWRT